MNSVRRIAALLIFLMIAPTAWAMTCATDCAMTSQQHMSAGQTSDAGASAACCHGDTNPNVPSLPGGANDCGMAAACHFAFSPALSPSTNTSLANIDTYFALPISSAPRSADTPPPFKPPA